MAEARSDYIAFDIGDVLVVEDIDGDRSVASDVGAVISELTAFGLLCEGDPKQKIIYRDKDGEWSRIVRHHGHYRYVALGECTSADIREGLRRHGPGPKIK